MSIPNNTDNVVLRTNADRSQNMYLDTESLPHIMGVLTNLYADKVRAVIREYSTNAMDANIAAGKPTTPIRVTLPTFGNLFFEVADDGVGLSDEDVFRVYGGYGASTKRDSNDFNGQLGLGCKSALTYASMFNLVSVKDGVKSTYTIHKDEKGIPTITRLSSVQTDAGNGVKVTIPVAKDDYLRFGHAATDFFAVWDVKPEGVNTFDLRSKNYKLTDDIYLEESTYSRKLEIIMGGVRYPVPPENVPVALEGAFVFAEMGDVDFTPSREALHMTKRTLAFINAAEERAEEAAITLVNDLMAKADTYLDAVYLSFSNGSIINKYGLIRRTSNKASAITYKGKTLRTYTGRMVYRTYNGTETKNVTFPDRWTDREALGNTVWMKDAVDPDSINTYYVNKAKVYAQTNKQNVFIPFEEPDFDDFDNLMTKEDLYKSVKLDTAQKGIPARRIYRDYSFRSVNGTLPADAVFMTRKDIESLRYTYRELPYDGLVYLVNENQVKRVIEGGGKRFIDSVLPGVIKDAEDAMTEDEFLSLVISETNLSKFLYRFVDGVTKTTGGGKALELIRKALKVRGGYRTEEERHRYNLVKQQRSTNQALDKRINETYTAVVEAVKTVSEEFPMLTNADSATLQSYINERINK